MDPFFSSISKDIICHIIYYSVGSSEQVGFESDMSSVIVDNSENAHIFSEEDMFTDKIEPIISNGVATIGGNDLIKKLLTQLSGPGMMMRGNGTKRNLIMYSTLLTNQSTY